MPYRTSSIGWPFDALRGWSFRCLMPPSGPASFSSVGIPSRGCEAFSAGAWTSPPPSGTSALFGYARGGERQGDGQTGQQQSGTERKAACLKRFELNVYVPGTWNEVRVYPRSYKACFKGVFCRVYTLRYPGTTCGYFGHTRVCIRIPPVYTLRYPGITLGCFGHTRVPYVPGYRVYTRVRQVCSLRYPGINPADFSYSGIYPGIKLAGFGHTRACSRVPNLLVFVIFGYVPGYQTCWFGSCSGMYSGAKPGYCEPRGEIRFARGVASS